MARDNEEAMSIHDQAAHWWTLLRDGAASPAEKREYAEWLKRAPENVEASLRVAQVHTALTRGDVRWPRTSAEDLIRAARAAPEDTVVSLHGHAIPRPQPRRTSVLRPVLALAASLLIALGVTWYALARPEQYQTKIGEQRSVLLADGSRVTLDTNSAIEVRLADDRRVIALVRGQALFEVAHDTRRPFDVRVGAVAVRAVGTQFYVDRRAASTTVTVVEGRVAILSDDARAQSLPVLTPGDRVVLDARGATLRRGVNLDVAMSWTKRQLVFQRRPLAEVAEEFNRYNVGRIEIRGGALREQQVTAIFRSDDVQSFVSVLAGTPGVRVSPDGAGGYLVTADESATAAK